MALQALLLSNDPEVHRTIRRVLDAANIDLDLSNNADQARHILLRRKYDALLVDCDDMPNGPLQLVVSIGTQKVTLFSNGVRVAQGPVSTGVPGHPTPLGVFSVIEKDRYHHSNIYSGAPMPYMQRIT